MIVLLLLLAAIAALTAARLWPTIAHDGLGVRPSPRSHRPDPFGAGQDS